ncbi:unnamed protein product [Parajaminaea phylloscopi]
MRITKAPKRLAEAAPQVKSLLQRIDSKADDDLPEVLDHVIEWCWPRGDLHYWTNTLNRFDDILQRTTSEYGFDGVQKLDFSPQHKRLVLSILRFSRLLIENCTNRKLYASYDRLNQLLLTRDNDVLEATLRLLLRPAQQYSSQGGGRSDLPVSVSRLCTLALTWSPKEQGLDMATVADPEASIPEAHLGLKFQFYHRPRHQAQAAQQVAGPSRIPEQSQATPATASTPVRPARREGRPTPAGRTATPAAATGASGPTFDGAEGLTTIKLDHISRAGKAPAELFKDMVDEYDVPVDSQFELFQKLRLAAALSHPFARRQLLICRLLAIACYSHLVQESTANTQLFLYEPDIIQKTASLIESQADGDQMIQAAGFYALDGLGRFRSKLSEVLSSVSASVNHGTLLRTLRSAVEAFPDPQATVSEHLVDSIFGFIAFVTSTALGSNMIVNAGLVPLLVQLVDTCRSEAYVLQRTVSRAIGLIDSVAYTFPPAFQWFTDARGLDVFVSRIQAEVDIDIQQHLDTPIAEEDDQSTPTGQDSLYGKLSFGKSSLLRNLFKSISHMMTSTGTADGLRGLIDSSLLDSVQKIFPHRRLFGPQILALAINVIATFIHNEATSLSIIQEKKIPEMLLDLFEEDIEASSEVISAIPNVIGAICLNEAGLNLFNSRRDRLFAHMFAIFTSPRHAKVLQDRDTATTFGQHMDELIRHQPSMKQSVLDIILSVLDRITQLGHEFTPPTSVEDGADKYTLQLVLPEPAGTSDGIDASNGLQMRSLALGDVVMDEADIVRDNASKPEDAKRARNDVMDYMDVITRFLDGFFQFASHCKDFLKSDGPEKLYRFVSLPCLPYNFPSSTTADSLTNLLRYMCEVSPNAVLTGLLKEAKVGVDEAQSLWSKDPDQSSLSDMLAPADEAALLAANKRFRQLLGLNTRLHLLTDVLPTLSYGSAKTTGAYIQSLQAAVENPALGQVTVPELGELHRIITWENIMLKAITPPLPKSTASEEDKAQTAAGLSTALLEDNPGAVRSVGTEDGGQPGPASQSAGGSGDPASSSSTKTDARLQNITALRYIMSQIPFSLSAFFSDTAKALAPQPKRSPDVPQRLAIAAAAYSLGEALTKQFTAHASSNSLHNFAYATMTVGFATDMLYEDKATTSTVHTLVLRAFESAGGVQALLQQYDRYVVELDSHFNEFGTLDTPAEETDAGKEASLRLGHVCGGLKVALNLLQNFSASRPLYESPETLVLLQSEGTSGGESFKPHELLLRLRLAILPVILRTWTKPWLGSLPLSVNRSVLQTLLHIVQAEGEDPPKPKISAAAASSTRNPIFETLGNSLSGLSLPNSLSAMLNNLTRTAGSAGGERSTGTAEAGGLAALQGTRRAAVTADPARIQQLEDMGFPRGAARHALARYGNNANAATEYLLAHPEVVSGLANEVDPPAEEQAQPAVPDQSTQDGQTAEQLNATVPATTNTGGATADQSADAAMTSPTEQHAPPHNAGEDTAMQETTNLDTAEKKPEVKQPEAPEPSPLKAELDVLRKPVVAGITERGLELTDRHAALVFDVKDSICIFAEDEERTRASLKALIDVIFELRSEALTHKEKATAIRLHLLALILNDDLVLRSFDADLAKATVNVLSSLCAAYDQRAEKDRPAKWLSPLLLVASSVLGSDGIISMTTPRRSENEDTTAVVPLVKPRQFEAEAHALFELCLRCLSSAATLSHQELLALYRLLVLLTRNSHIASSLTKRNGINTLLQPFCTLQETVRGCQTYLVLCLRHVIEATGLLKNTIRNEVRAWFKSSRYPSQDAGNLARGLSQTILREPELFLEVVKEDVEIAEFVEAKGSALLRLIKTPEETQDLKIDVGPLADTVQDMVDHAEAPHTPSKPGEADAGNDEAPKHGVSTNKDTSPSAATLDSVIHLLLSELLRGTRERPALWTKRESSRRSVEAAQAESAPDASMTKPAADQTSTVSKQSESAPSKDSIAEKQLDTEEAALDASTFYICFLMQTLSELLSSYVECKTSFLNGTKKRLAAMMGTATASIAQTPSKVKNLPGVLTLFLSELVPIGFLEPCSDVQETRRRVAISNWAMSTIVALAADVGFRTSIKDAAPELISTRKHVLDALARSIKDASSSKELIEVRYGRLYALSDLTQRLLVARPNADAMLADKQGDDVTLHMAKTMLEKGFVTVLTGALADIDLNLPTVKSLIHGILKPLDHLTKIAIKAQSKKDRQGLSRNGLADSDSESADADELAEGENTDREETPDFYRSSALGMHTGEMGEAHDSMDEDEDESMDDDEMEELEYPDAEDRSDLSDEDEDDDSDDEDDDDDEMSGDIVEVLDEDEDEDSNEEDDDGIEHFAEGDVEDGWTDEDDEEDEDGFSDDDTDTDDEDALDFVLDGTSGQAADALADLVNDDMMNSEGTVNLGPSADVDDIAEEDEDEESMDDSRYEEELDILQDIGLPFNHQNQQDRFGAEWAFTRATRGRAAGHRGNSNLPPSFFLDANAEADRGASGSHGGAGPSRRSRGRATAPSAEIEDPATHPLLLDDYRDGSQRSGATSTTRRNRRPTGPGYHEWAVSIEELVGDDTMGFFQAIFGRPLTQEPSANQQPLPHVIEPPISASEPMGNVQLLLGADGAAQLRMQPGQPGVPHQAHVQEADVRGERGNTLSAPRRQARRVEEVTSATQGVEQPPRVDPLSAIQAFEPLSTNRRWADEERIIFGGLASGLASRMREHVINALWPRWKESQRTTEQQQKDQKDLLETTAERDRILDQLREMRARLDQNRAEVADLHEQVTQQQQRQQEHAQASSDDAAPNDQPSAQSALTSTQATREAAAGSSEDVLMSEATPLGTSDMPQQGASTTASSLLNLELASLQRGLQELDSSSNPAGSLRTTDAAPAADDEAGAAEGHDHPLEESRVVFMHNGREVDITDLGIDSEVLAALPEEMQDEVIGQALRERHVAALEAAEETNISPEFLDALPPELRAEVLEQEAEERARSRRRAEASSGRADESQTIENADRSAVNETTSGRQQSDTQEAAPAAQQLPANSLNEAARETPEELPGLELQGDVPSLFGEFTRGPVGASRRQLGALDRILQGMPGLRAAGTGAQNHSLGSLRDAIQLLDTNGTAAIVRLLFFPGLNSSTVTLNKVLSNLALNGKTRGDILSMLLRILSDGSADAHAIDRSYANVSARAQGSTPGRPGLPKRSTSVATMPVAGQAQQQPHGSGQAQPSSSSSTAVNSSAFAVAPLSRAGEEAPHLMAARSIETLMHLTSTNENCAIYFLTEDAKHAKKQALKGKERDSRGTAPINVLLDLLDTPSILSNAQLVESLVSLLNVITKHIPNLAAKLEKAQQSSDAADKTAKSGEPAAAAAAEDAAVAPGGEAAPPVSAEQTATSAAQAPDATATSPASPLYIPKEKLGYVVRPLATAISSKGFQYTLAIASHLASIDSEARDAVMEALQREAMTATRVLSGDLDSLLATLPPADATTPHLEDEEHQGTQSHTRPAPGSEGATGRNDASDEPPVVTAVPTRSSRIPTRRVQSSALPVLARPASAQARLLRSLRALEWLCTRSSS